MRRTGADQRGQAAILLLGVLVLVVGGALVLGGIARGLARHGGRQRAADLAALAAARLMHDRYADVFEPADSPAHLELSAYLARARVAAVQTGRRNGEANVEVRFADGGGPFPPTRVTVVVRGAIDPGAGAPAVRDEARATAELVPPGSAAVSGGARDGGQYTGPLAYRQGKPMRPDVAAWFDRMAAAARADGVALLVTSAFRTDAEQAALFAAHPDPKWVAPPGTSLHRLGTELDLGPASAYGWLHAHAERFHFTQRYAWEPWHYGFTLNAGTTSVGYSTDRHTVAPSFVPAQYAPAIARAAQRWNVSGALLAAQIQQESGFNPAARSPAGAQGISQFMPDTARLYGLRNPFDAQAAIDAQAHLMRDLLRRFGSVPLALAAYNAGERRVAACGCIPPIPETQAYVAAILGLLHGAGDPDGLGAGALEVRLVA